MNNFYKKSLISVESLTKEDINLLFEKADEMKKLVEDRGGDERLKGKILAALFYEPSSRTFTSFITAMQRLSGGVIPINGMTNTSVAKGETLEDSARVFSSYADVLVIRFPEEGSAGKVAKFAVVPVINAGDGAGEHPTQALLDCYTIGKHFSSFKTLTVGLVGDLFYGRTVHSLAKSLQILGTTNIVLISPKQLRMPVDIKELLTERGVRIEETESLEEIIGKLDVIYDTRVQKERFSDQTLYEKLRDAYIINKKMMNKAKKNSILMHPLPRVVEIAREVDDDPRALYFREQMRNGMFIRMALLDLILRE